MRTVRFAATVSYDGAAFYGSQRQPGVRTVQAELEAAAEALFGEVTRVDLAGRTDTGVHATGQVAALTVDTVHDAATVERALNAHLPEDVAVRQVAEVPAGFDPRRWARRRWYRYAMLLSAARLPLLRRTSWRVGRRLDVESMQTAASSLLGQHDFRSCAGPLDEGRSPVRTVNEARLSHEDALLWFDVEADAFLPQMVRRIVGGLVRVGRASLSPAQFSSLLGRAETGLIGPPGAAQGLCLQRVWYDEGYLA